MLHPSGKPVTVSPVFANVGVEFWYGQKLGQLIAEMYLDARVVVLTAAEDTPPIIAQDVRVVAAGILFECGPRILLVHRDDGLGWGFPGGGIEEGETPEEAARRETYEEIGLRYTRPLLFWHVQEFAGIGFATFVADVDEQFIPRLNWEHDDYRWATLDEARAMHLHPGVYATLFRGGVVALATDAYNATQERDRDGKWTAQGMSEGLEDLVDLEANDPSLGPDDPVERTKWALRRVINAPEEDKRFKAKLRREAQRVLRQMESAPAMDATPTKALQKALQRWGAKWIDRFDLMANKISLDFAARNQRATETAMQSAFKRAGFTVAFKPTRASIEAYRAIAAEQVGLIKSIAQKFHTDVEAHVWESVKRGADMRTLSKKLEKTYGITRKRASLIARDQNNKAKATIEAVRHQQLGIKQAIWMHSHAGKEPRPTHVKMNNKLYDLATGMYDSDPRVQRYIHAGELINCRCTMRPYIPGFG